MVRLSFVLLLCAAVWAGEAQDLKTLAYKRIATGQIWWAQHSMRRFLEKFPDHKDAAEVALALGLTWDDTDDEVDRRMGALKRVIRTYPGTWAANRAQVWLERAESDQFARTPDRSKIPSDLRPGKFIPVSRKGGGTSSFKLYRLDPKGLLEALLKLPFEKLEKVDLLGDEFASIRSRLGEVEVRFRSEEQHIKGDFSRPGFHVVEETTLGRKSRHLVHIQPARIYIKTLGGEAVGYARVPATIHLRTKKGTKRIEVNGLFRFPLAEEAWALVRWADSLEIIRIWRDMDLNRHSRVHISTDRPVYRPGQTVRFRAIRREWDRGRLLLPQPAKVKVEVRDPIGRTLQSREREWSGDFGTLSGSFTLADRPALGTYTVLVHVPRPEDWEPLWWDDGEDLNVWYRRFEVAEYRKPEMRVDVTVLGSTQRGGKRKVRARIKATYFFGGPVAGAEVQWEALQLLVDVLSSWRKTPAPPFEGAGHWWLHLYDEPEEADEYGDEVADGEGVTNAEGILDVEFEADVSEERLPRFLVQAEVTDLSNRTATGEARLEAAQAGVEVTVGTERMWYAPGDKARVFVRVRDSDGAPVVNQAVKLDAYLDDYPVGWDSWEWFFGSELKTDGTGLASCALALKEGGELRLRATTRDSKGRRVRARAECYVLHPGSFEAWTLVTPDKLVYEPGQTMRVLLQSVAKRVLLTIEGDRFHEVRLLEFDRPSKVVELEAKPAYAPAVILKVVGLDLEETPAAGTEVFVLPSRRLLDVSVATDKGSYAPRQKARVTVDTGVAAEVELAIVDESIFEIAGDHTPNLLSFFFPLPVNDMGLYGDFHEPYDSWESYRRTSEYESEVLLFGGQAEGVDELAPADTRRLFPDTMYWSGSVRAGADGKAVVEVETPDSLTRWRVVARAVAGADRFGVARSQMLTRKRVVARLAAPRFLVEGDECVVGVIVHNGLDQAQTFRVRLDGHGEAVTVRVAAAGQERRDFRVKAKGAGDLVLRGEALSTVESDAVEITIPVHSRKVALSDARSGRVEGVWKQAFDKTGDLEVLVTGSHSAAVREALPYLAGYPYGCVEQTMSRFLPAVVAMGAIKRAGLRLERLAEALPEMVDMGLQRLYGYQHEDGGWGWWHNDETNPWMTAYVVFGLATARQAGFAVDPKTLQLGLAALQEMEQTAFVAYARKLAGAEPDLPEAKNAEDRAYLTLAGKRGIDLPTEVPTRSHPSLVRQTALIVRALASADPTDERIPPLVDWLLRQRRGGAWYSTLDSAYAVMALCSLGLRDEAPQVEVTLNGKPVVLREGRATVPVSGACELVVRRRGGVAAHAAATLRHMGEPVEVKSKSLGVRRSFERRAGGKWVPLAGEMQVGVGERLRMRVDLEAKERLRYLMLTLPLPAGMEARNPMQEDAWWGDFAVRDDRVEIAITEMWPGKAHATIPLYATAAGSFLVRGASAFAMYDPDRQVRGASLSLKIR